ncbi:endonuclease LCL3 [Acrasis kona]|uniref:Endonuclease LCL3 n=1 Tax=Acrasis kona TaxID=1008807 RepID=A0AAW2ZBG5_9EUKA
MSNDKSIGDAIRNFTKFDDIKAYYNKTISKLDRNQTFNSIKSATKDPIVVNVLVGVGTLTSYFIIRKLYTGFFRRIKNIGDVRDVDIERQRILKGVCVSVGDGDNFRFFHKPTMRWFMRPPKRSSTNKLDDFTLHVRLAGMDAPECAHFGLPGQPMGEEVKSWLKNFLIGNNVTIQLLKKDQYQRVVCEVHVRKWWYWLKLRQLNVSRYMLQQGFGVAYEGISEIYSNKRNNDARKKEYQEIEQKARKQKIGMWSIKNMESPRDYKKRVKK